MTTAATDTDELLELIARAVVKTGYDDTIRRAMEGEISALEAIDLVAPPHLRRNGDVGRRLPKCWSPADHATFIAHVLLGDAA